MGHPIAHSKSPLIHARFAAQTAQSMTYRAIHVHPGELQRALSDFHAAGGVGLNITLPLKEEAYALVDVRTPRAERARAVNTIWFDAAGRLCGDNTDGAGLTRDILVNHEIALAEQRVLMLGAGGAARGTLGPLLDEGPALVVVANRTPARARELRAMFASDREVVACDFEELAGRQFDIIINATSASLQGVVPPIPDTVLKAGGYCYDMMYASEPTAFVRWGQARAAAKSVDGLGMLVEQAAESFYCWRRVRPDTAPVIAELRRACPLHKP